MIVTEHAQLACVIAFNGKAFNRGRGKLQTRESELEGAQIPANAITLTNYAVNQTE
jgi:hypothetical protein